jgi:hypothetical protein
MRSGPLPLGRGQLFKPLFSVGPPGVMTMLSAAVVEAALRGPAPPASISKDSGKHPLIAVSPSCRRRESYDFRRYVSAGFPAS